MLNKFLDTLLFLNTLPLRLAGAKIHVSSTLGPHYSFFGCHFKGIRIAKKVRIGSYAWLQTVPSKANPSPKIIIQKQTHIGRHAVISAAKKIYIGKGCLLSYHVSLLDHQHGFNDLKCSPLKQGITPAKGVKINNHCFIGAHSFILSGVILGKHCVVGANSVVTKSFPDFSVIAGSPAKKIRSLNEKAKNPF